MLIKFKIAITMLHVYSCFNLILSSPENKNWTGLNFYVYNSHFFHQKN